MPISVIRDGVETVLNAEQESQYLLLQQNWVDNVKPIRDRKRAFVSAKNDSMLFDKEEIDILLAGYMETKLVRLAVLLGQSPASVDTPVIDAINAVFPGQTKLQVATTIESRSQSYLTTAATALATKIQDGG